MDVIQSTVIKDSRFLRLDLFVHCVPSYHEKIGKVNMYAKQRGLVSG